MIAIITSSEDIAGCNLFNRFLEKGFKETGQDFDGFPVQEKKELLLVKIKPDIIHAEGLDELGADLLVFASRHRSEAGISTLTVHPTGVFGEALQEYGGRSHELSYTSANAMRNIYLKILENPFKEYQVSLEVTHHGPTHFKTPMFFVELGSAERQWHDEKAADFLTDCILDGLKGKEKAEPVIGIGGNHYAAIFSSLEAEEFAFGHICPKYSIDSLTPGLVEQMFKKTIDGPRRAVIDKKGIKSKSKILEMLGDHEVEMR